MKNELFGRTVLELVAAREGVSAQEVEADIALAISEAIQTSKENQNAIAMKFWDQISVDGKEPSPAKLISVVCSYLAAQSEI